MRRKKRPPEFEECLLAVDAGNSRVNFAFFTGSAIRGFFDAPAGEISSAGARSFSSRLKGINSGNKADSCLISSVVPQLADTLVSICAPASENIPRFLSHDMDFGVRFRYRGASGLGSDRAAAAAACRELFPGEDIIIVDAGTAVTFDFLNSGGVFEGGLILPGPGISAECLARKTGCLPLVEPAPFPRILADNTEDAVRSGIFWGFVKSAGGIISEMKRVLGKDARVVAAGGWSGFLREYCDFVDDVEPHLVLKGVNVIHRRSRK